jgi:hypothetical protein
MKLAEAIVSFIIVALPVCAAITTILVLAQQSHDGGAQQHRTRSARAAALGQGSRGDGVEPLRKDLREALQEAEALDVLLPVAARGSLASTRRPVQESEKSNAISGVVDQPPQRNGAVA